MKTGCSSSWWCLEYLQGFSSRYDAEKCINQIIAFIICIATPFPRTVEVDWDPPSFQLPLVVQGAGKITEKTQNLFLQMLDRRDSSSLRLRMMGLQLPASVVSVLGYQHLLPFLFFIKSHKRHIRGEILTTKNWFWGAVWHCFRRAARINSPWRRLFGRSVSWCR